MIRAAILNVTGYAGAELAAILYAHPGADLVAVTGRTAVGSKLVEVFPHLWPIEMTIGEAVEDSVDVVFSALPHVASAPAVLPFLHEGVPVIDLSADFRLRDSSQYQEVYGADHPAPGLLSTAVYGLPEVTGQPAKNAKLVANPGCYAAGALLATAPGVAAGIFAGDIVIDGKSGISGAGRTLGPAYHYPEANDNLSAYGLEGNGHRHGPEIEQELAALGGSNALTFVPHLVPMTRGILTTVYATASPGLADAYRSHYADSTFVRVVEQPPSTRQVAGTNNCLIFVREARDGARAVIVSVIDNLGKGAAGQAIQNMNRVFGLQEDMGLTRLALYP